MQRKYLPKIYKRDGAQNIVDRPAR